MSNIWPGEPGISSPYRNECQIIDQENLASRVHIVPPLYTFFSYDIAGLLLHSYHLSTAFDEIPIVVTASSEQGKFVSFVLPGWIFNFLANKILTCWPGALSISSPCCSRNYTSFYHKNAENKAFFFSFFISFFFCVCYHTTLKFVA